MDACVSVKKEIERVHSKFSDVNKATASRIDDLINSLNEFKKELEACGEDTELTVSQNLTIAQHQHKIREALAKVSSEHKELHGSVSKVGKTIDRNFVSDFSSIVMDNFTTPEKCEHINSSVCEHFLRHGMLDIANTFIQEASLDFQHSQKDCFLELHRILESLKRKDLAPALQWAAAHRTELNELNSSLEFKLHRLHFIQLVSEGASRQHEILCYAKNFAPFAKTHTKELQVLMGSLVYLPYGIHSSPYAYLLDPVMWDEICDVYTHDACSLLGLSVDSPLSIVLKAGCTALQPLLNIKQMMTQGQCAGVWSSKDELPVEISLERRYHSIFACPILRQQSTSNNPPMRLVCGHVISKDALNKLTTGSKVKCPYCPMEQAPGEAKQITF